MMLNIRSINPDPQLSVALANYFARLALPVWQQEYPKDSRPEKAIEAAERALFDAADVAAYTAAHSAAAHSAAAARAAARAARAAARAARARAAAAADAAAYAAYAADAAADAYAASADACARAATYAAYALGKDEGSFLHHHLTRLLPLILWHKLNSKQSFAESEKVFELLPEDCREDFLFNLDNLR